MALKLRVISEHHAGLGRHAIRRFGVSGGRIGRARDNDWVLPDPHRYISAHHCQVNFRAGDWVLQDTSTNGVFINEAVLPLQGEQTLQDGDVLRLGEYLLQVSIDTRNDFSPDASGQLPVSAAPGRRALLPGEDELGSSLDFGTLLSDALLDDAPAGPPPDLGPDRIHAAQGEEITAGAGESRRAAGPATSHDTASGTSTGKGTGRGARASANRNARAIASASNSVRAGAGATPDQPGVADTGLSLLLDDLPGTAIVDDGEQSTVAHNRTPDEWMAPARIAPKRPGTAESGVEAFCRGAGLDPASLSAQARAELLSGAGQVLREVVLGMMDLLKARTDCKDQLSLSQTAIRPSDTNPLKFSASVDEALVKLLDTRHASHLGPAETIRTSFGDLRTHHSAFNAALRVAMNDFMARLAPEELTERFDRGLKHSALPGQANKYWERYSEFYQVLNLRNEEALPTVFADDLARAYAEQVAQRKR